MTDFNIAVCDNFKDTSTLRNLLHTNQHYKCTIIASNTNQSNKSDSAFISRKSLDADHDPESIVVFLNQSAVFTCETDDGTLSWIVNGTQRETLSDEIISNLVISRTVNDGGRTEQDLTIPARAEYNGTRVQCLVLSLSGSDQSENATMIIQGITLHVVELVMND